MHPAPSPIYRPSRLTRLWAQGQRGRAGACRELFREGAREGLGGQPVSQGLGPPDGRVNRKVLMPGAVAKPSVGRKKQLRGTWWKGGPLPGPPFRCWGLEGVPFHFGRLGTRKRFGLDTPPPQSPGVGVGGVVRRPLGAESGVRGPRGGSASRGSGARPSPARGGAGPPLPAPAGTLRLCPEEAGVQQMHARGGRGGGGEEKTHNKTCVAESTARLEWQEPAPAERRGDSEERGLLAGRGAAPERSRYRAREAGWAEGPGRAEERSDFPPGPDRPSGWPGRGRAPRPLRWSLTLGGHGRRALPPGRAPPRCLPGRGLFFGQRLVPAPGPSCCAHLERI